jgi:hypothetical protein
VDTFYENGAIKIKTIYEEHIPPLVNGHRLKLYKRSLSKEEFVKNIQEKELSLVEGINIPTLLSNSSHF